MSITQDERRVIKFEQSTHLYEKGVNKEIDDTKHIRPPPKVTLPEYQEDHWRDPYDVPENFLSGILNIII